MISPGEVMQNMSTGNKHVGSPDQDLQPLFSSLGVSQYFAGLFSPVLREEQADRLWKPGAATTTGASINSQGYRLHTRPCLGLFPEGLTCSILCSKVASSRYWLSSLETRSKRSLTSFSLACCASKFSRASRTRPRATMNTFSACREKVRCHQPFLSSPTQAQLHS